MSHTCSAEMSHTCYKQSLTTTYVVDDIAYSFASALSWTRITMADGQKFLALKHLRRVLDQLKTHVLPMPPAFSVPLGVIPSKFLENFGVIGPS